MRVMLKLDYKPLDAAILAALASRPKTFAEFAYGGHVYDEARSLGDAFGDPRVKPSWRFVDSRLQALRKAGKIRFVGPKEGWVVVQQKAPHAT